MIASLFFHKGEGTDIEENNISLSLSLSLSICIHVEVTFVCWFCQVQVKLMLAMVMVMMMMMMMNNNNNNKITKVIIISTDYRSVVFDGLWHEPLLWGGGVGKRRRRLPWQFLKVCDRSQCVLELSQLETIPLRCSEVGTPQLSTYCSIVFWKEYSICTILYYMYRSVFCFDLYLWMENIK